MRDMLLWAYVWQTTARAQALDRVVTAVRADEAGEGVISAAIAVLIMAFLGVGLWLAFKATLGSTTKNVDSQVNQIGR
jgi:hypothetical protein